MANPLLARLVDDGEATAKVQNEIRSFLAAAGHDGCRDKFTEWRKRLQEARYADWKAARDAKAQPELFPPAA